MITETPPVEEVLNELRAELGVQRLDLAELVIAGARSKLRELRRDGESALRARAELAEMIRQGSLPVDVGAADEVKRLRLSTPEG